jgi:hypothetical protein
LKGDCDEECESPASDPYHGYFCPEAEFLVGEYPEVEDEDGDFGGVLDDCVEDLGDVEELGG